MDVAQLYAGSLSVAFAPRIAPQGDSSNEQKPQIVKQQPPEDAVKVTLSAAARGLAATTDGLAPAEADKTNEASETDARQSMLAYQAAAHGRAADTDNQQAPRSEPAPQSTPAPQLLSQLAPGSLVNLSA